jgi:hypothetical protein
LLDDTRQRINEEKEDKVRKSKEETETLGRELRYTQQVVASELAGWQDLREKMGRRAIRNLAKGMLNREKIMLESMRRATRRLKIGQVAPASPAPASVSSGADMQLHVSGMNDGVEVEVNAQSSSSHLLEPPKID